MFEFTLPLAEGVLAVTVPDTLPMPAAGQLGDPASPYPPPAK
jgi:hypothetical protein